MKPYLALGCLSIVALAGCSDDTAKPTSSFKHEGTRVFESYGQNGNFTKKVTIPPGTKSLRLKMDCINASGDIKVEAGSAWGDLPCGEDSNSDGYIGLGVSRENQFDSIKIIEVTAPVDATWSVAVDALDTPLPD